jgi:hypothetical protein
MITRLALTRGLVAAAALVAPVLAAAPVDASTSDSGCTVTPERPRYAGFNNASNIPVVKYKVTVSCDAGLAAQVNQERWEQDLVSREGEAPDDLTGESTKVLNFPNGGTKEWVVLRALPNTGPANEGAIEEVYQAVSFRVKVIGFPPISSWTPFELTNIRAIHR